ncbi:hypothetical protein K227x_52430 [Rubripirellula lacrimiformis]|uniref:Uncharacterized protein n=1 Tax=Rubripirellula lacrimiformis TaxID=1930273 RepID=A0A517NI58_9BACT|nr:hypothetical protein [Rubripirellula lacrimiformis]QDT06822.1 hypothetical protein K227x_52430 [Rubripirellula lacrimiformis]
MNVPNSLPVAAEMTNLPQQLPRSSLTSQLLIARWIVGAILGTLVIAATSPLFVRSYLPREFNRGVWTLPAGATYRWRSEGYAATHIGPHGMPGRTSLDSARPTDHRIAIWGDSQAEGVCVDDADKIFAAVASISDGRLQAFPLARSGDDLADWIGQFEWAQSQLGITDHVLVIAELSDLHDIDASPEPPPGHWSQWGAANLPAFVLHAVRGLTTSPDGSTRRLRFAPRWGDDSPPDEDQDRPPTAMPVPGDEATTTRAAVPAGWDRILASIQSAASGSVTLVYCPRSPHVMGGRIVTADAGDQRFAALRDAAAHTDITIIDTRPALSASAMSGQWPHGFANGQIGTGHLNAFGNRIVAEAIVRRFPEARTGTASQGGAE